MTKLIQGYLSVADGNGEVSFAVQIDNGAFSWSGPAPSNKGTYSNISRLHFLSDDGNATILAVVACLPVGSTVKLDSSSLTISLALRNLLSDTGITLSARLVADRNGNPIFAGGIDISGNPSGAGFFIGNPSDPQSAVVPYPFWSLPAVTVYADTLLGLTFSQGIADPVFKTKWIDSPSMNATGAAPFEAVSGPAFNSGHITFHIRPVVIAISGDTPPVPLTLPVLTIRRGYTATNGDWPIVFPFASNPALQGISSDPALFIAVHGSTSHPGSNDSDIHAAQFPSIAWLAPPAANAPCAPAMDWHVETSGFNSADALEMWNTGIVAPYLVGLRTINAAYPVSFVPAIVPSGTTNPAGSEFDWRAVTTVREATTAAGKLALNVLSTRLLPGGLLNNEDQQPSGQQPVSGILRGLRAHDAARVSFNTTLNFMGAAPFFNPDRTIAVQPVNYFDMQFTASGIAVAPSVGTTSAKVRLGSLDLTFDPANVPGQLVVQVVFQPNPLPEGGWLPRLDVEYTGLPVAAYGPGGQDPAPLTASYTLNAAAGAAADQANFTQAAPIVIDASTVIPAPPGGAATYALDGTERTIPFGNPQQIVLTLRSIPPAPTLQLNVLVLDPEPFLAARIELNAPVPSTDSDDSLIGNWCNLFPEGPGWRLQDGASGFKLFLPPQAIGEAMVKGLAIDDGNAPQDGNAVDFRFSPVMTAQLLASFNAQNAVEPSWNTRRVLGNPSQSAPGAALDATQGGAQFELLYGLTASVTAPNLRLSEIFARLGTLPGPLPDINLPFSPLGFTSDQAKAYQKAATLWSLLYKQVLSKTAVLELYDASQGEDLVLDSNVDFTIRFGTHSKFPGLHASGSTDTFDGGLGYALDSANVASELLLQPNSVGGKLMQPRFTALGGYGSQRAEFANGKVIVDSRTSMGRIETLTITLVGRIGVLWNHALHVTVYERSVEPSQQFFPEQDEYPGRPLLRKTAEYVEILQTTRAYPESATGNPVTSGFVQGSVFKSARIPVDSAWGADVFSKTPAGVLNPIGWQVPLWKPGAQPTAVYSTPHIALLVAVDPALGVAATHSEISDPQKLCFYTDTQQSTSADTDSWPPVVNIDFTPQPTYSDADQASLIRLDDLDPIVDPGFGQFTYHFVPSQAQVNLVAARTQAAAVGARLTNASMMRSQLQKQATGATSTQQFGRVQDWWTATRAYLEQRVQQGVAQKLTGTALSTWLSNSVMHAQGAYLQKLSNDLNQFNLVNQTCTAISGRLNSALTRANGQGTSLVNSILVNFPQDLQNTLLSVAVSDTTTYANALEAQVKAAVKAVMTTLNPILGNYGAITDAAAKYATQLASLQTNIVTLQGKVKGIGSGVTVSQLLPYVAPLLPASAVTTVGSLRATLDSAAALVDQTSQFLLGSQGTNLVVRFDSTWDAAMIHLAQLAGTEVNFPPDVVAALNTYLVAPATLITSVSAAIAVCQNVATNLTKVTPQGIEAWITSLQTILIADIEAAKTGAIKDIQNAIATFFSDLPAGLGAAKVTITQAISDQTNSIKAQASALCNLLAQDINAVKSAVLQFAATELSSLLNSATDDEGRFLASLQAAGQQVEAQLAQVAQGVVQDAQQVATAIGEPLRLLRAFGEPPQVATMGFNGPGLNLPLPSLKYVFDDLLPNVNMTPVLAGVSQVATGLVNDANSALSQLGLSLPTSALLDRFVPDLNLANFNLNSVLPSFAGLDLSSLLSGLKMPDAARNFIHVSHKIDPQTKRASLDADIDFPIAEAASLLDIGPVSVQLTNARFTAHVHCDAALGQQIKQTSSGQISGDWVLLIGGVPLVTFVKTALAFDSSGALTFSVNPANVRLASVLQFLADIVNSFDFGDSGFSAHATAEPLLVQCILDLPLPDMSGGAFGIQNLDLGAIFEVGVSDLNAFFLGVGANLGRRTAPFDLTIFVLGGAGWMESYLRYSGGTISGTIDIGIAASASLAIALGPIDGSVSIYFGLFATLQIGKGGGFQLGIMLLIDGHVNLLGIVDADISLLLEAEYSSGGGLTGRGVLSISIKICWCFTLDIHTGVQYSFGAAPAASPQPQVAQIQPQSLSTTAAFAATIPSPPPPLTYGDYYQAANDYVTMLA